MSNTLTEFRKKQYEEFTAKLGSDWGISDDDLASVSDKSKSLHKKFLSIACIASVVSYRQQRYEYASSLVDVSQLAIILGIKGAENSANVLLRQTIELTLKHIYFLTHPTEYNWARTRDDYRDLSFQGLLEYIQMTDEFRALSDRKIITEQLTHHYSILSRYVHAHSGKFQKFSSFNANKSTELLTKLLQVANTLWPVLICLLVIYSHPKYSRASDLEKRLIRSSLTPKYRNLLDSY